MSLWPDAALGRELRRVARSRPLDRFPSGRHHGRVRPPEQPRHRPLTRADLPAEFTPETLRRLGFGLLRRLADGHNGVLDAKEQEQFDAALAEVMKSTGSRVNETLQRARRPGPDNLDPSMRRSYQRTQQRLAEQTRHARESFPELALPDPQDPLDQPDTEGSNPISGSAAATDDVSPDTLEKEVEQTSETLDMLERIASLQQQQLAHQESQLLTETRGVFFAFLVSLAVIIAGIAPLVEAEPHERVLIVLWTVVVTAAAGLVYALVRRVQQTR